MDCRERACVFTLASGQSHIYVIQCWQVSISALLQVRCSIVVSLSACHAEDPGSIPNGGVCIACLLLTRLQLIGAQLHVHIVQEGTPGFEPGTC